MLEFATSLEGDTYDAFVEAAKEFAAETGVSDEDAMRTMRRLIYLFVTRI